MITIFRRTIHWIALAEQAYVFKPRNAKVIVCEGYAILLFEQKPTGTSNIIIIIIKGARRA